MRKFSFKVLLIVGSILLLIRPVLATEPGKIIVSGKVLEKGSASPLGEVTVYIEETESETSSGSDGSFQIPLPGTGTYSLFAVGVGYKKSKAYSLAVNQETSPAPVIIYLEPDNVLSEMVISAARTSDQTAKIVATGKELEKVAGSAGDPIKGMQSLPGVTTGSDTNNNPAIRGSGPSDNLYYVDFLPVGYLFHMGGLVSVFNADTVDDFNIYSAAHGPEFGDVTGGIIDVKLREPRQDKFVRKINASIYEADFLIEGPINKNQSFFIGARRSYIDLFLSKTGKLDKDSGEEYKQFPNFYDYQGKYVWKMTDNHTLNLLFNGANDSMKLYFPPDSDTAVHEPILAGDFSLEQSFTMQGMVLSSRLSEKTNNRLGISYADSQTKENFTQMGHTRVGIRSLFFRDQVNIRPNQNHEIIVEGEAVKTFVDLNLDVPNAIPSDFAPPPDATNAARVIMQDSLNVTSGNFGIKDRYRIVDPITLILGGRAGYNNLLDEFFADPRIAAEIRITKDSLLTAGWGTYHQFPDGVQVIDKFGNPDVNLFRATHYVLGLDNNLAESWQLKVEGYYKKLSDLVVPKQPENFVNGGSGKAYGVEVLLKKKPMTNWSGWVSLGKTYTERTNDLTGEDFPYQYDQPVVVNLVANYKLSDKWTIGAKWRYQSGAPYTPVVGTKTDALSRVRPIYGELGSERLPDYHRLDIRVDREFLFNTWKMGVFGEIINAYARDNVSGYQYNADYTEKKKVKQLPLFPSIGIRAEF